MKKIGDLMPDIRENISDTVGMQYINAVNRDLLSSFGLDSIVKESYVPVSDWVFHELKDAVKDTPSFQTFEEVRYRLDQIVNLKDEYLSNGTFLSKLKVNDLLEPRHLLVDCQSKIGTIIDDKIDSVVGSYHHMIDKLEFKNLFGVELAEAKIPRNFDDCLTTLSNVIRYDGDKVSIDKRQAIGVVLGEFWNSSKNVFAEKFKNKMQLLSALGKSFELGLQNVKLKFNDFINKYIQEPIIPILEQVCSKVKFGVQTVDKLFRKIVPAIGSSLEGLIVNARNLPFVKIMQQSTKSLATGVQIASEKFIKGIVDKIPFHKLPIFGTVLKGFFASSFFPGLLCNLVWNLIVRSKLISKIIEFIKKIPTVNKIIDFYKRQGVLLNEYLAKLYEFDIERYSYEVEVYSNAVSIIENCNSETELNTKLLMIHQQLDLELPWGNRSSFDEFMNDSNSRLVFR